MSPKARTKAKAPTAAQVEQENAAHEAFLATYEPVITRHPDALAAERAEQVAAEQAQADADAQAQAERDAETAGQVEAQQTREQEDADYRAEHYPGT